MTKKRNDVFWQKLWLRKLTGDLRNHLKQFKLKYLQVVCRIDSSRDICQSCSGSWTRSSRGLLPLRRTLSGHNTLMDWCELWKKKNIPSRLWIKKLETKWHWCCLVVLYFHLLRNPACLQLNSTFSVTFRSETRLLFRRQVAITLLVGNILASPPAQEFTISKTFHAKILSTCFSIFSCLFSWSMQCSYFGIHPVVLICSERFVLLSSATLEH